MQAHWIASAIAVGAVIVAGGLVLLARAPGDEPPLVAPSSEPLTIAISDSPRPSAVAPAPPNDALAAAKVRELDAMSETYRNTTFVIAIRDAGYTCNQLLRVYGIDDSGKWTVTCTELLGYTIGVNVNGALRVEPMMPYFDGVAPRIIQNDTTVPAPPPPQPR
ncbi:MAG TPA: hypothetical protein VLI71_12035 [Gammaproteobacteria bacterium]|nr:hypothetical protein [Gammaproteobacteria bacterium]